MKKFNQTAAMKFISYSTPEVDILGIKSEGVLCSSTFGSSAEDVRLGDEINDYTQIY